MTVWIRIAALALWGLLAPNAPVLAMGSTAAVTWLGSASELPDAVQGAMSGCSYITPDSTEAWGPDNETGAFYLNLGDGGRLYIVTCELAASNAFDAAVRLQEGRAERLVFPFLNEDGTLGTKPTVPNSRWQSDGVLSAYLSTGCAGAMGVELLYRLTGGKFDLVYQKSNQNCDSPSWHLDYGKEP